MSEGEDNGWAERTPDGPLKTLAVIFLLGAAWLAVILALNW